MCMDHSTIEVIVALGMLATVAWIFWLAFRD